MMNSEKELELCGNNVTVCQLKGSASDYAVSFPVYMNSCLVTLVCNQFSDITISHSQKLEAAANKPTAENTKNSHSFIYIHVYDI